MSCYSLVLDHIIGERQPVIWFRWVVVRLRLELSLSYLNQPIQVGFAPAVAESAVEGKCVVMAVKLFNCPHADH